MYNSLFKIKRLFALLLLSAALLPLLFSQKVDAQTTAFTFNPTGDAYVQENKPDFNKGTANQLRADGSPLVNSFVKFNVQGLSGNITSAVLRIYANSNHSTGYDIHSANSGWDENSITYNNQPAFDPGITGSSGPLSAGTWYDVDVTSIIAGNGEVNIALTTTNSTAMSLGSRESNNQPELIIETEVPPTPTPSPTLTPSPTPTPTATPSATPTPPVTPSPTPTPSGYVYLISTDGSTYYAQSQFGGNNYSGTVKQVVESAVSDLDALGGGAVTFQSGTYDLGTDWLVIVEKTNIVFEGQGIDVTVLQNNTNEAKDTEPFSFTRSNAITIRDMTVVAGGSVRSTSDALDFDDGSDNLVERVKITASRARGIVFDGKDAGASADRNIVRDCEISGTYSDGIELLASSDNTIQNCYIHDTVGYGIQLNKSSASAPQANKSSNNNLITLNTIDNAGSDGINVNSGSNNQIVGNTITNSSDDVSSRDGIRLMSFDSVVCDGNFIDSNIATDNQATQTQNWGLNISSSNCHSNVVGSNNDFTGNKSGEIKDLGTGTIYQ